MKNPKVQAIMNIGKGEQIVGMWVTPQIPQTGVYKLLAKQKADGTCEWAHLVQRADGSKELLFTGEVNKKEELQKVVDVANKMLEQTFGPEIKLGEAQYDMYSLDGGRLDDSVN